MGGSTNTLQSFTVLGHRGAKGHAPENTLVSFERAIELGATMAELDIHLSKDRELIVMHDATVDRTTNGTGIVSDLTLAEIKALDAGAWFDAAYRGHQVPTLQEVIDLTRGRILLNVEVKRTGGGGTHAGISELLAESLVKNDFVDQVVVSSFEPIYLKELRQLLPSLQLGLLYSKSTTDEHQLALDEGWEALHPHMSLVDQAYVDRAHASGLLVRAWNPNEVVDMIPLIERNVDGIGTDFPERLLELARKSGKIAV